ncbi:hypothetical protein PoB_002652800 [Plakobranchus ocellatus]|uniref:Uncharacterized protein n=1 Tax=Plakobranchus ocellatus TaxID=259542 RepID=A0AAV3ZYR2_9GAST|nr:hypothetical protein PoB_002652800 [Plakobranchus ocellatus]
MVVKLARKSDENRNRRSCQKYWISISCERVIWYNNTISSVILGVRVNCDAHDPNQFTVLDIRLLDHVAKVGSHLKTFTDGQMRTARSAMLVRTTEGLSTSKWIARVRYKCDLPGYTSRLVCEHACIYRK